MKVIKPQPLLFQFAPTQIGRLPRMGFSLGIAFRLSDPRVLVHEANVWAAVKAACSSVSLCELSLPKKHAEWILLGHSRSSVNKSHGEGAAWEWTANVRWGDSSKSVSCQSVATDAGVAFLSMDHSSAAQSPPRAGVVTQGDAPLMLMGRLGAGADSTAAMGPVDQRWPERQRWMPKFQASPEAMEANGTLMGWPAETDLRLFQQAFSNQWSRGEEWPADLDYALHGFGPLGVSLEGSLPPVAPQLLVCRHKRQRQEFHMPRLGLQTAWLLPDRDIAVLWWHGEVPLDYVLDNSIQYAAGLIAEAGAPPRAEHLKDMARIRMDHHSSDLLNESDFPLMPPVGQTLVWEQVLSAKDHPNNEAPIKPYDQVADELNKAWRQMVALDTELKKQIAERSAHEMVKRDYAPVHGAEFSYALRKPELMGPDWRTFLNAGGFNVVKELNQQVIRDQDLTGLVIKGWTMNDVRFERCNFSGTKFIDCHLSKVDLIDCQCERSGFCEVKWERGEITNTLFKTVQWRQMMVSSLVLDRVNATDWRCVSCSLKDMVMDAGTYVAWILDDCDAESLSYLKSKMTEGFWKKSQLSNVSLISADCSGLLIADCMVDKLSAVDANFDRLNASVSRFKSLVLSRQSTLNDAEFCDCTVEDGCWIGISAQRLKVKRCSMKQINLEDVRAEGSHWHYTLLTDAHLKDALMMDSHWRYVSLCGANLCAADFSSATVKDCNLSAANLSWTTMAGVEKMSAYNVMGDAQLFPRRPS